MQRYSKKYYRNSNGHGHAESVMYAVNKAVRRGVGALLGSSITEKSMLFLVRDMPELFKITSLSYVDQAALLIQSYQTFKNLVNPEKFPADIRYALFLASPSRYVHLIAFNKLKQSDIELLLKRRPSYAKKVPLEVQNKFPFIMWEALLNLDFNMYAPDFMENINRIRGKTDLRQIFRNFPKLVWMIMPEHVEGLTLTPKELLLFVTGSEMKFLKVKLRKATFKEVDKKLTMTVLAGKDKNSPRLKKARSLYK